MPPMTRPPKELLALPFDQRLTPELQQATSMALFTTIASDALHAEAAYYQPAFGGPQAPDFKGRQPYSVSDSQAMYLDLFEERRYFKAWPATDIPINTLQQNMLCLGALGVSPSAIPRILNAPHELVNQAGNALQEAFGARSSQEIVMEGFTRGVFKTRGELYYPHVPFALPRIDMLADWASRITTNDEEERCLLLYSRGGNYFYLDLQLGAQGRFGNVIWPALKQRTGARTPAHLLRIALQAGLLDHTQRVPFHQGGLPKRANHRRIATLLSLGLTTQEIAAEQNIKEATLHSRLAKLALFLGVKGLSRGAIIRAAWEQNQIDRDIDDDYLRPRSGHYGSAVQDPTGQE